MNTPKVAFWIYDEWAFGSIHKALVKEFYKRGINADLIPWQTEYSKDEKQALVDTYDIFVSTPGPALNLLTDTWGIERERIVMISHGEWDVCEAVKYNNDLSTIKGYGVISNNLVTFSKSKGIDCPIHLLQNGILFDTFYREPTESLNTIGYAGKLKWENHYDDVKDLKRSYLVATIGKYTNTKIHLPGKRSHLCMAGYYKDIDCVIMSSDVQEACGLPIMEAAAAGRLPIAARVGINNDMKNPTGIILPVDETAFIEKGIESINELKENPELFRKKCIEAQEFAREYYDWSKVIDPWIELIIG